MCSTKAVLRITLLPSLRLAPGDVPDCQSDLDRDAVDDGNGHHKRHPHLHQPWRAHVHGQFHQQLQAWDRVYEREDHP